MNPAKKDRSISYALSLLFKEMKLNMTSLRKLGESYSFIIPSLIFTVVLGIYPILWAIRYMFYSYPGYGEEVFIGFGNFAALMRDEAYWNSVVNTAIYASGKIIITIPLSLVYI